jgi:hypothetical protein
MERKKEKMGIAEGWIR